MRAEKKIWLIIFLPIIIIGLIILAIIFPSLRYFLLIIFFLVVIPGGIATLSYLAGKSGVSEKPKKSDPKKLETSSTGWSWFNYLITFGIVIAVLGTAYYFLKDETWPWSKPKPVVWHFTRADLPAAQRGIAVFDKSAMTCDIAADNSAQFAMTCYNEWVTEDFLWIKSAGPWGTWNRRNSELQGRFGIVWMNDCHYTGGAYSANNIPGIGDTFAPFNLWSSRCKS